MHGVTLWSLSSQHGGCWWFGAYASGHLKQSWRDRQISNIPAHWYQHFHLIIYNQVKMLVSMGWNIALYIASFPIRCWTHHTSWLVYRLRIPSDTWRNNNVIITPKTTSFDVRMIQGFYWPLISHRPIQACFTYDTISPTWRTHDTGCFTFRSITICMGNIRKPIHSFHHNRHYTYPKYNEGLNSVVNIKMAQGRWLPTFREIKALYKFCKISNYNFSSIIE